MPVGVIFNVLAVFLGGLIGALAGSRLSDRLKEGLKMIFGVCAMGIGINAVIVMENMPAVVLATILGTALGLSIRLGERLEGAAQAMQRAVSRLTGAGASDDAALVTVIVLFCASGTGIYGTLVSGMTGDHSILLAKSVLDIFTAMIFACTMGMVVSLIAIPQAVIFLLLYFGAGRIYPLTTPAMINDFKAVGGLVMLATGFRMVELKMFPTADMIPAMALVMPISWLWMAYAAPLLG